jgi:hypothetical protein
MVFIEGVSSRWFGLQDRLHYLTLLQNACKTGAFVPSFMMEYIKGTFYRWATEEHKFNPAVVIKLLDQLVNRLAASYPFFNFLLRFAPHLFKFAVPLDNRNSEMRRMTKGLVEVDMLLLRGRHVPTGTRLNYVARGLQVTREWLDNVAELQTQWYEHRLPELFIDSPVYATEIDQVYDRTYKRFVGGMFEQLKQFYVQCLYLPERTLLIPAIPKYEEPGEGAVEESEESD